MTKDNIRDPLEEKFEMEEAEYFRGRCDSCPRILKVKESVELGKCTYCRGVANKGSINPIHIDPHQAIYQDSDLSQRLATRF